MVRSPCPRPSVDDPAAVAKSELTDPLWAALDDICHREGVALPDLLADIRRSADGANLADAVAAFVARYFRRVVHATECNRARARH